MKRPIKPYKSLEEFRVSQLPVGFDAGVWPCLLCHGEGCDACDGTGVSTKEACKDMYDKVIEGWKIQVEAYKRYRSILAKLTKDEIEFLRSVEL